MVDFIIWKKDNGIIIYFYIIKKPSCKKNNRAAIENNLAIQSELLDLSIENKENKILVVK